MSQPRIPYSERRPWASCVECGCILLSLAAIGLIQFALGLAVVQ